MEMTRSKRSWKQCQIEVETLIRQKDFRTAESSLLEALGVYPCQIKLLCVANNFYRIVNKPKRALSFAKLIIENYPNLPIGYIRAAQDLCRIGKYDDALSVAEVSSDMFPNHFRTLLTISNIYRLSGQTNLAIEHSERILDLYSDRHESWVNLCNNLIAAQLYNKSIEIANDALKRFPGDLDLMIIQGDAYRALGNRQESLSISRIIVNHHKTNYRLYIRLIEDLIALRSYSECKKYLHVCIVKFPDKARVFTEYLGCIDMHQFILSNNRSFVSTSPLKCDVCCIASDEAPYIAEFIHHYLYLGFQKIFIGINNRAPRKIETRDQLKSFLI